MLRIDDEALGHGLERATDLFRLHRLSHPAEAEALAAAVFDNFGIDEDARMRLAVGIGRMVPVEGDVVAEVLTTVSLFAGVLVGLLIADAALSEEPGAVPDRPPADLV